MAFAAPLIGSVIGGVAATGLGEAVIGIGLSLGASYLSRRLQPKPSTQSPQGGMRLSANYDADGPREAPFGTSASAGSKIYQNAYGPNGNDYLQLVFKLGDVPCDSLVGMQVNGKAVTFGSVASGGMATGTTITEFPGAMWVEFHNGAWAQSADADLVARATGGSWTTNDRGRGVCYVRVTLKYDPELYKDGLPRFLFIFRGAKLYDISKDSTAGGSGAHRWGDESTYEWTDNPAVILYNYLRGLTVNGKKVGGMSVPAVSLPSAIVRAQISACNELVSLKAGGTEKRYRLNGVVDLDSEHTPVIRDMLASMAGLLIDSGGVLKLQAGVAQASVASVTDSDIMSDAEVRFMPKLSRASLVNAVFGSFNDPAQNYEAVSLPPRISPADQASDGGTQLTENYGLKFVSSGTQGQRILEILRRKGRYQRRLTLKLKATFSVLEAGDVITVTSSRYGFSAVTFEVLQATLNRNLTVSVELKETAAAIFAWSPALDELDPLAPAAVGTGGTRLQTAQNVELDNVLFTGGGVLQHPALRITWDPITDATVVSMVLRYRKVGDTVAIEKPILIPSAGEFTWFEGIQGGVEYEAQLDLVTLPVRATVATGWHATGADAQPQIVSQAASVPPNTITPAMLSEQVRREIALITDTDAVTASVQARLNEVARQAQEAAAAAIGALAENTTQLRAIRATAEAGAIAITETLSAVGGAAALAAQWAIKIDLNGNVIGAVQLSGDLDFSQFSVIADKFAVAFPGVNGGLPQLVFAVVDLEGEPTLVLQGTMIADTFKAGLVQAETVDSVFGSFGVMQAGMIRNAANTSYWNLDTGDFQIG